MSRDRYRNGLSKVVNNSLLHLYMSMSESSKYLPTKKRNELLLKFLKPMQQQVEFKSIKSELKKFILLARKNNANLESKLLELHSLISDNNNNAENAQQLFGLIDALHDNHRIDVKFVDSAQKGKQETLYILYEHIEYGFDKNGRQIAPISLFYQGQKSDEVFATLSSTAHFNAERKESNDERHQSHFILHPKAD